MRVVADECRESAIETMAAFNMIRPGEKVLVAVSGGPDSMALLYLLHDAGYPLEAAYFDHQTRDGESAADGAFVRAQAAALEIPFHTESRPVAVEAQAAGQGFEAYARAARYAFLERAAAAAGCAVLATGHHADDLVETVLMRLLRGAAPHGLAGIPPARSEGDLRIVRPLLRCTRVQILAYVNARDVPYRTDRTNTDARYLRNRVRHELLPLLREAFNPRVDDALVRLAEVQRDENDLLDDEARTQYAACVTDDGLIRRRIFSALHVALQRRVMLLFAWRHGVDAPFDRIDAAVRFVCDAPAGRNADLGCGVMLHNSRDLTEVATSPEADDAGDVVLPVPGVAQALGKQFEAVCLDAVPVEDLAAYCSPCRQVFDAEALGPEVVLRRRRPGDRFQPLGMTGTRKLKDYFVDLGLSAAQRDKTPLLVARGDVAWVVARAVAAPVAVTPQTQRVVEVRVSDALE